MNLDDLSGGGSVIREGRVMMSRAMERVASVIISSSDTDRTRSFFPCNSQKGVREWESSEWVKKKRKRNG